MTDDELKELVANWCNGGSISHNQGDVVEKFFYQSLVNDNRLGSITFDDITKIWKNIRGL